MKKLKKMVKDGHIEKKDKIPDDVFIHPTVITVKKDKSVKTALDYHWVLWTDCNAN